MFNTLANYIEDMENGVMDFTKDGECSNCGQCCSALLPVSREELKRIRRYVKKKNLKPHRHMNVLSREATFDMTCPFLDNRKEHKCDIYEVRPDICKRFICNVPPSKVEADREMFWKTRKAVYMWDLFKESTK